TKSLHGRSLFPADLFIQPGDQPPIIKEQKIIRRRSAARPWAASGASLACPALQNYPRDLSQCDALPPCPLGLVGVATELRGRGPPLDLKLSRVQAADAYGPHPTGKGAGVADIWLVARAPSQKRRSRLEIQSWRSDKAGAPEYRRVDAEHYHRDILSVRRHIRRGPKVALIVGNTPSALVGLARCRWASARSCSPNGNGL